MIISAETNKLNYDGKVIEPEINREASNYIISNYSMLLKIAGSYGIDYIKSQDLLQDVYISVYTAENNGNGFDMQYGLRVDNNKHTNPFMNVEQYVIARLAGYSKNDKYRSDICESYSTS